MSLQLPLPILLRRAIAVGLQRWQLDHGNFGLEASGQLDLEVEAHFSTSQARLAGGV